MKAIGFNENLPIDNEQSLMDVIIDQPKATGKDILVKVKAIAVNPVDYKIRLSRPSETPPQIIGWDVAGVVEEVGDACQLYKPGDEVYYAGDLTRPGGNSEYHLVDERIVGNKPQSLDFKEAAALPLTGITAYESLFDRLKVSKSPDDNRGTSLLIIGAAGGVGSMAVQLAKQAGLTVIGTASRPETVDWVTSLGADFTITHYEPFKPQLDGLSIPYVDYILCFNSTDSHWNNMVQVIKPQGTICSIVETHAPIDLNLLKAKSVGFVWELMFTRSMFQTDDMIKQHHLLNHISQWIDAGVIKTTVNEILSPINAENLRKAHKTLEEGKTIGKIVLSGF